MAYQHPLVAAMSQLGAGLGQGISGYTERRRILEERDRLRAIQDQDRARQMAAENYNLNAKLIPGMLQAGQYEAAATTANRDMEALRKAGFTVPNAPIVGGTKEVQTRFDPAPRAGLYSGASAPSQGPLASFLKERGMGADSLPSLSGQPMSFADAMTQGLNAGPEIGNLAPLAPEKLTARDFANPQTQAAIRARYGVQQPQPDTQVVTLPGGGVGVVTKKPDGGVDYKELKTPEAKAPTPKLVQDPVTGEWFTPTPGARTNVKPTKARSGGGAAPKPRYGWVQQPDGTKRYQQLTEGTTAAPAPKATPKPKAYTPKAWSTDDKNKADAYARGQLGIRSGRPIPENKRAAYDKLVAQERRDFEANERRKSGEKSAADKFFESLE